MALASLVAGVALALRQAQVRDAYRRLGRVARAVEASVGGRAGASGGDIDWDMLCGINPDVVAWVRVEGTDIDLPVVRQREDDADFYLWHDVWGMPALEGTPFLDLRCGQGGPHWLVYGHHLSSGGQFSQLQLAYERGPFSTIGFCHWHTPEEGERVLLPLCALHVDQWYRPIQRFDLGGAASCAAGSTGWRDSPPCGPQDGSGSLAARAAPSRW